ncbi:hypothetical protein [Rathayibacter sp. Leaf296]|uniref:hypothetical protein n=1 Tax=Rathayibacter sp. Leaf296 TaxID=1736327 RepID=UPI0007026F2E|nr:hypothetical protein [Rathayibacter sp. Leaf296]KQQ09776.1 hypothetical protein ASF46_01230 [Rathayibacter sp. Leaf296]
MENVTAESRVSVREPSTWSSGRGRPVGTSALATRTEVIEHVLARAPLVRAAAFRERRSLLTKHVGAAVGAAVAPGPDVAAFRGAVLGTTDPALAARLASAGRHGQLSPEDVAALLPITEAALSVIAAVLLTVDGAVLSEVAAAVRESAERIDRATLRGRLLTRSRDAAFGLIGDRPPLLDDADGLADALLLSLRTEWIETGTVPTARERPDCRPLDWATFAAIDGEIADPAFFDVLVRRIGSSERVGAAYDKLRDDLLAQPSERRPWVALEDALSEAPGSAAWTIELRREVRRRRGLLLRVLRQAASDLTSPSGAMLTLDDEPFTTDHAARLRYGSAPERDAVALAARCLAEVADRAARSGEDRAVVRTLASLGTDDRTTGGLSTILGVRSRKGMLAALHAALAGEAHRAGNGVEAAHRVATAALELFAQSRRDS